MTIHNPILPGFHPDPSICRVGSDYYIANSTFEWFPGVRIHHSRDLVHWRPLTYVLTRRSQLDLIGNPNSGGVWAPCLSYHEGLFYCIYSNMRVWRSHVKDVHNYLVTAPDIMGPWSEPIFLNSSGFDPSLFHDEDGSKWLLNMLWDHRKSTHPFAGIVLQQYDPDQQKLVGPIRTIFEGTDLRVTEGPHVYKENGWYYLMTAEGGTNWGHAVTMARSRRIEGPYEVDPENPMLTSREKPELSLQKAGHASVVKTQNGKWYMAFLCSRPVGEHRRCILGRETALSECKWTDSGWLRLVSRGNNPPETTPAPGLPLEPWPEQPARDNFDGTELGMHWNSLRDPSDESWVSLTQRPGHLRIYGRESLRSLHHQSMIARRLQNFQCTVETCMDFSPVSFQQEAGLICWYDTNNYYYLRVRGNDSGSQRYLGISLVDNVYNYDEPLGDGIDVTGWKKFYLRAVFSTEDLRFFCSHDGITWKQAGDVLDATILSDDYCTHLPGFTGAFVGMCCQDMSGRRLHADFDYFEYRAQV